MEYAADPVFGFQVPRSCDGIPPGVLNPATSWPSTEHYMQRYRQLAFRFVDNFKKFEAGCPPEVIQAGPVGIGSAHARPVMLHAAPAPREDEQPAVTTD